MRYFFLLLLLSCQSPRVAGVGPLSDLVFRPLKGFDGKLVNRDCAKFKGKVCTEVRDVVIDLMDAASRKQLWEQHFRCRVAGRSYGICQAEESPGLCEVDVVEKKFLGIVVSRTYVVFDFIHGVGGYQRLLNANAYCASLDSVVGRQMFRGSQGF